MFVRRLINAARVSELEMLSACTPRPAAVIRPLTGSVCGPTGREVVATCDSVATIEAELKVALADRDLFGAVVEYTAADGSTVSISRILPGIN